jgi:tetratricopeptide (TPR) repeat protein
MNPAAATETEKITRARVLCAAAQWPAVLAFAEQWQAEDPASTKAFFYRGVALTSLGRLREAETAYRRALQLDGKDFKIWNNLAALLFGPLNRPAEAAQCLAHALKLEPQNKLGWANLASLHGQLGRHAEALQCAERALAVDPQMVEAQLHRARAAQALGKTEIVRAASEALAQLPAERFKRTR